MQANQQSKNNKQQMQSVTDVTLDSLKKIMDKNDFDEFRNLILGNYNNPQWLNSIGGENKNTQPTISFVGGIILQDAIMKIFDSMNKNMFDQDRLKYFQSPVFVKNFITEIKHVTQVFEVKGDDENSTEFGKWLLDVFNACFKVRPALGGDKATNECKRVLWDGSDKETYMKTKETVCYICKRPWIGRNSDKLTCDGSGKLDLNFVHCEHVVPFLAALYHVKLARAGDSLNDPILDTQYALAHNGCNELKNNFQMYMKASKLEQALELKPESGSVVSKRRLEGGTTMINVQDGGVATRSQQARAIIDNGVAPERLEHLVNKEKKRDRAVTKDKTQNVINENLASEFQFMYVPNMPMINALYDAIVAGKYEGQSENKNSTTLNKVCDKMKPQYLGDKNYPILERLTAVLKYINTNIDKLRTDNTPEEQVEMLYDLWGKFKLILAISPNKLNQIFLRGETVDTKGVDTKGNTKSGGGVQVGGAESDYDIMKEYIGESVKDLFGTAQLNTPLRITGGFKLKLGMTDPGLNANHTYYEFKMTQRNGSIITTAEESKADKMGAFESDVVLSEPTIKKIHETVDGTYKYTYDTKNNLKYLEKVMAVDTANKTVTLGKKIFILKDPTNSDIYAVEYVNFGEITNSSGTKFGVYTVFLKDTTGRSISSSIGGGDTRDNDVESEYNDDNDDNEENEGDVRYANFRRVSKTLRSKQKHGKTSSKRSKTFKKR
jgi:hypothetical protein